MKDIVVGGWLQRIEWQGDERHCGKGAAAKARIYRVETWGYRVGWGVVEVA